MATDINEVYKMFPCAKAQAEENMEFWGGTESLSESNMPQHLEVAVKIYGGEEDLYQFFEQIINHDHFLMKENHITPWDETKRNRVIENLTQEHLGYWHDALYNSPKVDEFLDDITYWKIISQDQF